MTSQKWQASNEMPQLTSQEWQAGLKCQEWHARTGVTCKDWISIYLLIVTNGIDIDLLFPNYFNLISYFQIFYNISTDWQPIKEYKTSFKMAPEKESTFKNTDNLYMYNRKLKRLVICLLFSITYIYFQICQVGKNHLHSKQINDWIRSAFENSNFPKVKYNNITPF